MDGEWGREAFLIYASLDLGDIVWIWDCGMQHVLVRGVLQMEDIEELLLSVMTRPLRVFTRFGDECSGMHGVMFSHSLDVSIRD
jgi:hypothetical protein